ncbi:hypothetical protein [Citrobacter braakii]|uniref:hypothetical protein n=1 Tax=Citrobacter braakii TaxID=57706 RepID=UPI0034E380AA
MTLYEMEGFLRGKCLPGDMMVNESDAQYLVRKFSELQSQNAELSHQLANAESKCRALAAENAALKSGVTFFAYSPEYGFDYFKDQQSAVDTAQEEIDAYREDADDGWSEDVQRVSWGVVIQQAQGFDAQNLHTSDSQHTYQTCDYRLVDTVETPATDAFLAEVRASAVDEVCLKISNAIVNCYQDEQVGLDEAETICGDFAAQIRKGAAL